MPICEICGVDHADIKKIHVVAEPVFDINHDYYMGTNAVPMSTTNRSDSIMYSAYVCEDCAKYVHGILTEQNMYPYSTPLEDYNLTPRFFYSIADNKFCSIISSYSTQFAPYLSTTTVLYCTKVNDTNNYNFYNFQRCGYITSNASRTNFFSCFYYGVLYHMCNCRVYEDRYYSLDAFVSNVVCEECGDLVNIPAIMYHRDSEQSVCSACYEDLVRIEMGNLEDDYDDEYDNDCDDESENIHDYGYKPNPVFYSINGSYSVYDIDTELHKSIPEPFFGVELEVDDYTDTKSNNTVDCDAGRLMDEVPDFNNMYYIKHDSSLTNGMEIVSHPMTLAYHLTKAPWKDIITRCIDMGYRSNDVRTCGLHVHVNCNSLGRDSDEINDTKFKMILFSEVLWDDIKHFSRRSTTSYCGKYDCYEKGDNFKNFKYKTWDRRFRNAAINITNSATVEVRIIKGTLNEVTFRASLQFVFLLRMLSMEMTDTAITNSTFKVFTDCAKIMGFSDFLKYCEIRGL